MRRPFVLLATSLLLLLTIAAPAVSAVDQSDLQRVIVEVRSDTDLVRGLTNSTAALRGGRTGATFRHALQGFVAELPPSAIAALARDPRVIRITPDYEIRIAGQETPTGFDRIEADLVPRDDVALDPSCPSGGNCTDVDIAILDTGVADHPDLNVVHRVDCSGFFGVCTDNTGDDDNGHGTFIAGVAAAMDNGQGVIGVAPGARIWSVKVLDASGSGYLSSLVGGIDWVTGRAAEIDVANMSLTGQFINASFDTALSNSVAAGVTYAVAAGNDSTDAATYSPASHPEVLTVSAVGDADGAGGGRGVFFNRPDETDEVFATFSNYGEVVDIAAPGVNLISTKRDGSYGIASGTSVASPLVAGAAALYVAKNGRDVNGDTLVNGTDVAAVMTAILADAIPQDDECGFSGDPDGTTYPEPLLNVNGSEFGGLGTCVVASPDESPPPPPDFTAVADGFEVAIDWSPVTDPESGILTYQLWRDSVMITETNHTVTSFVDLPQSGTSFSYQMTATNRQGIVSDLSAPVVVTVSDGDRTNAGHWTLDDGSGLVAADSSDWHRDGVVVGTAGWEPDGRIDGALNFSGSTDRVDLESSILDGAADVTTALWIRTTKTGTQAFISGANSDNNNEFLIYPTSHTSVTFYTGASTRSKVSWAVPSFADGQWHHFTVTRDAANNSATLFIDGLSQGALSAVIEPLAIDPGGLVLGQEQDSVGGGFDSSQRFVGDMDDLRVYTRILTNQEIHDLAGVEPDTDPPAAPTGLTATANNARVDLNWSDNSEPDLAGYTVFRADTAGGPYTSLAPGLAASVYSDTGVVNGTTYYYVVTATDTSGNESANSNEVEATPVATAGPEPIDFDLFEIESYGGTQDRTGTVEILHDGATLSLTGNLWKKISFPYEVTHNTVIEFDFSSNARGEVHGIGFDTNNSISQGYTFQVYGSQRWGIQDYRNYEPPGVVHYKIPIGAFYTGSFPYLFFAMDHDVSGPTGQSTFSNVKIYEAEPPAPGQIDFNEFEVVSYGGSSQDKTGTVEILGDGATLSLTGNLWKKINFPYVVTPNTVIEFDFSSDAQGDVHGIGFDTNNSISKGYTFQVYGTQTWGIQNYRTYESGQGWAHYEIPIGQHYTGNFPYLFFAMDHDVSNPNGQATFSNIIVYESG